MDLGKSFQQMVSEKCINYRPESISVQITSAELRGDCWKWGSAGDSPQRATLG